VKFSDEIGTASRILAWEKHDDSNQLEAFLNENKTVKTKQKR
jgi:hypothetical protein